MPLHVLGPAEDLPWTERAACRDCEPAMFFPPPGGDEGRALAMCHACEVQFECLTYAVEAGERYGIWGGTTQRRRRRLLGRRPGFGPDESTIFDRRSGGENPLAAKEQRKR